MHEHLMQVILTKNEFMSHLYIHCLAKENMGLYSGFITVCSPKTTAWNPSYVLYLKCDLHFFPKVKEIGRSLWEAVIHHLQLVESDYFGLQYEDSHGLKVLQNSYIKTDSIHTKSYCDLRCLRSHWLLMIAHAKIIFLLIWYEFLF